MEKETMNTKYKTRSITKSEECTWKSRVDWKRTKKDRLLSVLDSDSSTSDGDREEEDGDMTDCSTSEEVQEQQRNTTVVSKEDREEEESEECVTLGTLKRTSSVMYDSDGSSDSEGPVRKVFSKRRCIIDEDECDFDKRGSQALNVKEEEASSTGEDEESLQKQNRSLRKKMRLAKLKELSARRRSNSNGYFEDSSEEDNLEDDQFPLKSADASDLEDDDSSLKDFIVEDEEEEKDIEEPEDQSNPENRDPKIRNSAFVQHHIPLHGTRQKKYAQEMILALHYLDDRFIQPRLENLVGRSRWKERYKERVECYPRIYIYQQFPSNIYCQACELQRYCKFSVVLSGQLYNKKTLEVDDFMSHDKQVLKVGSVCADRTRVYHQLRHFKYNLYRACNSKTEEAENKEGPVKDIVERLFSRLKTGGWIQEQYRLLEKYMDEADYFQEEKMN
uniref:Coiled-coil domain-containing protein 82 isoform X2 n=1 Tax=Geotrypetes seraphini TaxID=260995 RepID=A0A6P8RKR8_GEOSA|nr:coiled-coil domain-containing protein 82 isoform X2 [Geotrypetes seraphini]